MRGSVGLGGRFLCGQLYEALFLSFSAAVVSDGVLF